MKSAKTRYDVLVIGGGATGLGVALDASTRGFSVLLVEQGDIGQATSTRSTKLIHGGVRYLKQGNISLVRESLVERSRLLQNAPDVVHPLPLVIPAYKRGQRAFFGLGMWIYDRLAKDGIVGASKILGPEETADRLPGLRPEGLRGGVLLWDGQFDDARLLVSLVRSICKAGGSVLTHHRVNQLRRDPNGRVCGAEISPVIAIQNNAPDDADTQQTTQPFVVEATHVVNATGIFADRFRSQRTARVRHSRGSHLVLPRSALPGDTALLVPETRDGRVLFMIPWLGATLLGTTDIAVDGPRLEPQVTPEEVNYLLEHARKYIDVPDAALEIRSRFAGLRPLVTRQGASAGGATSKLSRKHVIEETEPGLLSVMGGKWTTYRRMAEDAVDVFAAGRPCATRDLALDLSPPYPIPLDQPSVRRAVLEEHARRLEDVMSRRSRWLLLDAVGAVAAAPQVVAWMADALGEGPAWIERELAAFGELAAGYLGQGRA